LIHYCLQLVPAIQKYQDKFRAVAKFGGAGTFANGAPVPAMYVVEFNPKWGYTGETLNGKPNGQTYTGAFANGLSNGYGVLTDSAGNVLFLREYGKTESW